MTGHGGGGFSGGGFGGGGFHGGAFAGGFHGGPGPVVRGGGFHGFGPGPVVRGTHGHDYGYHHYGCRPYGYWGDYAYDYPYYTYDDSYYDNGSCYVVQRRVHTARGSRLQPRQVCG
jgi:hypothetical protein